MEETGRDTIGSIFGDIAETEENDGILSSCDLAS
jgi:hypothetical protein